MKKQKAPLPLTTTTASSSAKTKQRRSAPIEAPPLIPGVSSPALTTPASTTGPTPIATGALASSIHPTVAASAATIASGTSSIQIASAALRIPTAADDPPTVTIPQVPATYTPLPKGTLRGFFPSSIELGSMAQAMLDLNAFTGFAALMGSSVEPASSIASRIARGLAWRAMRDQSEAWTNYVKDEDALAWQYAMKLLTELRPSFRLAVAKTPSLATQYPGLNAVFSAGAVVAKKAAITKAKNAKTKAASNAGTASAAPGAPATAVKAPTIGS
jgi:hypothetical protein